MNTIELGTATTCSNSCVAISFVFLCSKLCRYHQPSKTCIVVATEAQQLVQSFLTSDLHGEHGKLGLVYAKWALYILRASSRILSRLSWLEYWAFSEY